LTSLKKRAKILAQHFGRVVGAASPIIAGSSEAVNRKNRLWKNKFDQARHGTKREQKFWRPQGILTGIARLVKRKNRLWIKK